MNRKTRIFDFAGKIVLAVFLMSILTVLRVKAADEHVWLHVEGKYIKRSPVCSKPNEIWMGVGYALYAQMMGNSSQNGQILDWLKARGINHIRLAQQSFLEEGGAVGTWPFTRRGYNNAQEAIDDYIASVVTQCRERSMYVYIDAHYSMHNRGSSGAVWNVDSPSVQCQRWMDDWVGFASYFKNEPWVLGYELCNEPAGSPLVYADISKNIKRVIQRIRTTAGDTKHIVLVPFDSLY